MEMVEALATWGLEVTVVEMKDQILPALLDADMAGLVAKYLREKGFRY